MYTSVMQNFTYIATKINEDSIKYNKIIILNGIYFAVLTSLMSRFRTLITP